MKTKRAHEIIHYDVILYKQKPFVVWDIDTFFINDLVAKNYGDYDEVRPEDSLYTFYHETGLTVESGLIETVINKVKYDKEFYFLGEYKPEYDNEKDNRAISRKLRFKILFRDEFKCVLCGRGAENDVKLHVDHKIPHSLGGQTIEENLQTLCEDCNLGKKNRAII